MKAKRRVCALLFSALMIWQGFMIVNAEGAEGAPVAVADGVEEAGTENATATPGRGATDGKDTTLQEGDGSGSGLTALKAPTSEAPAQQVSGTPAQTGTGSVTPTEGGDSGSPATSASSVEAGEARERATSASATVAGAGQTQRQSGRVDDVIQEVDIRVYKNENETDELKANQTINIATRLQLKAKLKVEGRDLHKGDYAEIKLPSALKSNSKNFVITAGEKVVANGEYNDGDNIIRITFNENIEKGINKDGEFSFTMQMNTAEPRKSGKTPLEIEVNGNIVFNRQVIYDPTYEEKPKTFYKDTVGKRDNVIQQIKVDGKVHYLVRYQVTFDAAHYGGHSRYAEKL